MDDILMYEKNALEQLLVDAGVSDSDREKIRKGGNQRPNNEATVQMSRTGEPQINIAQSGLPIYLVNINTDENPDFRLYIETATGDIQRPVVGKVPPRND